MSVRTQRLQTLPTAVGHLAESLRRIQNHPGLPDLRFGSPVEAPDAPRGWRHCSGMLDEPRRFAEWRGTLADWLLAEFGEAPERTTAGYLQSWYLQVPARLGALLFHHERRVPSLRPEHLFFRIAEHGRPHPDGIALTATEFACLPDDPAAGAPEATVVESDRALAGLLRARYAAHAAAFVRAYGPMVRFGRHALWATATDGLDAALWNAGRFGGDESAGVADAALVLPAKVRPFTSASTLHATVGESGRPGWTRRRESCCFHYLLNAGDGECATCPRRCAKS